MITRVQIDLKKKVDFKHKIIAGFKRMIESDGQRIKQILINLLRNAIKFTFSGFIEIVLKSSNLVVMVDGQTYGYQDAVQFIITDTGIGISNENKKTIFKMFGKID